MTLRLSSPRRGAACRVRSQTASEERQNVRLRCGALVDGKTFALPTSHHPLSGKDSACFGHDRALRLASAVRMKIKNDPIAYFIELVRASGVREQRGEVPLAAVRMKNWKPSVSFWIEALGSDFPERVDCRLCAVFAIYIKQDINRRLIRRTRADRANARQHLTE